MNSNVLGTKVNSFFTARTLIHAFLGSVILALAAQVAIPFPFSPVPVTLQTLAVSLLAYYFGPKKAALSIGMYLMEATLGFPVLAGGMSNPAWLIGMRGGYLLSYVLSAWTIGTTLGMFRPRSLGGLTVSFAIGHVLVLLLGAAWLSLYLGVWPAIYAGLIPFILPELAKCFVAATSVRCFSK
jgi:biotin transport system substrate-specific component